MTDQEIVQVLRCCRFGNPCTNCPAAGRGKEDCFDEVHAAAVATIERLTAENAVLREKQLNQLWEPVFAGNPERKGCYLVTVNHWLDGTPVVREAFWNGVDWLSCERRHEITPRVTHWMPLPEAPEAPAEGGKHE